MEDGRERLSWPARNANLFAGEESCVWPLRPSRSRRRRPSVTPDPLRSAWVWPARTGLRTTCHAGYRRSFASGNDLVSSLARRLFRVASTPCPAISNDAIVVATSRSPPTLADPGACLTMLSLIVEDFQTGRRSGILRPSSIPADRDEGQCLV